MYDNQTGQHIKIDETFDGPWFIDGDSVYFYESDDWTGINVENEICEALLKHKIFDNPEGIDLINKAYSANLSLVDESLKRFDPLAGYYTA